MSGDCPARSHAAVHPVGGAKTGRLDDQIVGCGDVIEVVAAPPSACRHRRRRSCGHPPRRGDRIKAIPAEQGVIAMSPSHVSLPSSPATVSCSSEPARKIIALTAEGVSLPSPAINVSAPSSPFRMFIRAAAADWSAATKAADAVIARITLDDSAPNRPQRSCRPPSPRHWLRGRVCSAGAGRQKPVIAVAAKQRIGDHHAQRLSLP